MGENKFYNKSKAKSKTRKNIEIPDNFKILLVDDDDDFRGALSHRLRRKEVNVVAVESGNKALTVLKDSGFDLILLDLKMPGMEGVETFKKIIETKKDCVVIIMTAFHEDDRIKLVKELNPFGFLEKPFEFAQLIPYIEKIKKEEKK